MSRLINDDLLKKSIREKTLFVKWQKVLIETVIDDQPTVEAVPVIRCKDCKYWQTDDGTFPDFDGRPWHECKCLYMFRAPDGEPARTIADFWCGYGERRKDNG